MLTNKAFRSLHYLEETALSRLRNSLKYLQFNQQNICMLHTSRVDFATAANVLKPLIPYILY